MDVFARLDATVGECPLYHAADDVLYAVDIPAGRLWRCPLTGSAEHIDIGEPLGCVAFVADGGLWGAGEVRRYDDDGRLLRTLPFPTAHVSSCSFGGAGGDRLFVTTARAGIAPDDPGYAEAGAVFVVDPGVTGPLPTPFRRGGGS